MKLHLHLNQLLSLRITTGQPGTHKPLLLTALPLPEVFCQQILEEKHAAGPKATALPRLPASHCPGDKAETERRSPGGAGKMFSRAASSLHGSPQLETPCPSFLSHSCTRERSQHPRHWKYQSSARPTNIMIQPIIRWPLHHWAANTYSLMALHNPECNSRGSSHWVAPELVLVVSVQSLVHKCPYYTWNQHMSHAHRQYQSSFLVSSGHRSVMSAPTPTSAKGSCA